MHNKYTTKIYMKTNDTEWLWIYPHFKKWIWQELLLQVRNKHKTGAEYETADHYFLHCTAYDRIRQTMLANIPGVMPINAHNLLFGNNHFDRPNNIQMFAAVQQYIIDSNRFS